MLAHSFNRFYIVTKFIFVKDLKLLTLNFDSKCEHLKEHDKEHSAEAKQHILDLTTYCRQILPHMYFYKQQIMPSMKWHITF